MIRPLSSKVLLEQVPVQRSASLSLVIPEKWAFDVWEHRIVSVGPKVTLLKAGDRVIVNPTLLNQQEFEYGGRKFKLVESADVQMLVGVPAE